MSAQPQDNKLRPVAGEGDGENSSSTPSKGDSAANHGGTAEQRSTSKTDAAPAPQAAVDVAGASYANSDGSASTKLGTVATPAGAAAVKRKANRRGKSYHFYLPPELGQRFEAAVQAFGCTRNRLVCDGLDALLGHKRLTCQIDRLVREGLTGEAMRLVAGLLYVQQQVQDLRQQVRLIDTDGRTSQEGLRLVASHHLGDLNRNLRQLCALVEAQLDTHLRCFVETPVMPARDKMEVGK